MNTERSMDRMELMMKARAQAHTLQAHTAETEDNIIETTTTNDKRMVHEN